MAIRETSARHEALGLDEDDLRRMHYNMPLARRVDDGPGSSTARAKRRS